MSTATVHVDFVNPPRQEGGKFGSIKTKELGYVSVPVKDLGLFTKGQSYSIEYTEKGDFKNFAKMAEVASTKPNGHAPHTPDAKDKMIFVTGLVGRALGSGKYQIADIGTLTRAACEAYDECLGK